MSHFNILISLLSYMDGNDELFSNIRAACESGWDFSSRWLRDANDLTTIYTTEILPVDLNCLLYFLEKMKIWERKKSYEIKATVFELY